MKDTREFHRKAPVEAALKVNPDHDAKGARRSRSNSCSIIVRFQFAVRIKFIGGEQQGTYLELHAFHERYASFIFTRKSLNCLLDCSYVNMPAIFERIDYLAYLSKFDKLREVDRNKKLHSRNAPEYKKCATVSTAFFHAICLLLQIRGGAGRLPAVVPAAHQPAR